MRIEESLVSSQAVAARVVAAGGGEGDIAARVVVYEGDDMRLRRRRARWTRCLC